MSEWREIWKKAIIASKYMILNNDSSASDFESLFHEYKNDGMLYFEKGISYEILKNYPESLSNYEKATDLFPVPHWKKVAEFSIERVKAYSPDYIPHNYDGFYSLQWNAFLEVHKFINITDENRYLAISALARIDSDTTVSLVNFRTVMEKELKNHFPEVVRKYGKDFCLSKALSDLKIENIDWKVLNDMDNVREEGNLAAHENEYRREYLKRTINSFIRVLEFFNNI